MNSEQPVLDAISELVDWQLEEGRKREDDPEGDDGNLDDALPDHAAILADYLRADPRLAGIPIVTDINPGEPSP